MISSLNTEWFETCRIFKFCECLMVSFRLQFSIL